MINYQSHLQNVKDLIGLLTANGIPHQNITIFSSDGEDPSADLATREVLQNEDFWLLPKATVGRVLRPPKRYVDSAVEGFTLQPATREALWAFFSAAKERLHPGDTLLFYVTDHGNLNEDDPTNNTITLWGETLSVDELRDLFSLLNSEVHVVMLMSQCFAGSFAYTILPVGGEGLPLGNLCGYFAAPPDRPAYGCYPENVGKAGVGHSHKFLQALGPLSWFREAHRRVLVTDDTPDAPSTTSDFLLAQQLLRVADETGRTLAEVVDALLDEAWQDRAAWEPEIRLLDRIGHAFGSFSPRSLAELEIHTEVLAEFSGRLETYAGRWRQALEALRQENLRDFLHAHPGWAARLEPAELKQLDEQTRRATAADLLAELLPFTESDAARSDRLQALRRKAKRAAAASYRAEARLGVVLRMKTLLTSVAGRTYVARYGSPDLHQALARLDECEAFALSQNPVAPSAAALEAPQPFPPIAQELRLADDVMPAWMGIQYRPVAGTSRQRPGMKDGSVLVTTVFPDSPALTAGIQVGDIILGPPTAPFVEPHQIREWTMGSEIGTPESLTIVRRDRPMQITLRPGPYPLELPKLPGPPKVGSAAPPLKVDVFRGATRLPANNGRLLFFWATWCRICHSSLPELLAFSAARNVEVVAITDEDPETLRRFFPDFPEPFPTIVATDPYRATFQSYGVSGTPTFVLVDAQGIVRHYQTGYSRKMGLRFDDWQWEGPPSELSNVGE